MEKILAKNTVRMKVFPHTTYEKIDRSAARHLYRLLQRYNWSLEDPTHYQERWAAFWPHITLIERKAFALFVMANSAGNFGIKLHVSNLPVDLEAFEGHPEPVVLTDRVRTELERVVGMYYTTLAKYEDVVALLTHAHPNAFAVLENSGGMDLLHKDGGMYPQVFHDKIYAALVDAKFEFAAAGWSTKLLDMTLQTFVTGKDLEV